jgi:hypothetical protein
MGILFLTGVQEAGRWEGGERKRERAESIGIEKNLYMKFSPRKFALCRNNRDASSVVIEVSDSDSIATLALHVIRNATNLRRKYLLMTQCRAWILFKSLDFTFCIKEDEFP